MPAFQQQLKQIDRKHPGTAAQVNAILANIAAGNMPPTAQQIPGLGGQPVFKLRIRVGNAGTQSGGRLIFYHSGACTIPLFIYMKANTGNMAPAEIQAALRAAGLL